MSKHNQTLWVRCCLLEHFRVAVSPITTIVLVNVSIQSRMRCLWEYHWAKSGFSSNICNAQSANSRHILWSSDFNFWVSTILYECRFKSKPTYAGLTLWQCPIVLIDVKSTFKGRLRYWPLRQLFSSLRTYFSLKIQKSVLTLELIPWCDELPTQWTNDDDDFHGQIHGEHLQLGRNFHDIF